MRRLVGVLVAALVFAFCVSDELAARPRGSSVLEPLADDGMCDLISDSSVEQVLGTGITAKQGLKSGSVERGVGFSCGYNTAWMTARLSNPRPEVSSQEFVDREFTNLTLDWRPVGEYEDVPGLGNRAAYGRHVMGGEYVDHWKLCVLFDIDGERLALTFTVHGPAALDQLRPLAEEAMTNLAG